ncbi:hypothetical protein EX30DRAFT_373684 [Ascodesmis nigricans]|uniref:RNase H type-1 domain-containing protein n=1 Tax=Ascodesmis nigricans TaxID=341454 RepID=A0A4S2MNE8_9PEZI|nr:hypothetical protein EX30DRAFT_373684 [Ascodesmis nigricans]
MSLGMRYWPGEGFNNIVLVCDSEHVVKGITEWAPKWMERDEALVQFWRIPRDLNEEDPYAKEAAALFWKNTPKENRSTSPVHSHKTFLTPYQ